MQALTHDIYIHRCIYDPPESAQGDVPVLAFAGIIVAVLQTLLVPVIADLPQHLDTTPGNAAWVFTSTLLSGAVATPIMGRLGDLYGKRRLLIASLTMMVVGSVISAFTSDFLVMIVGRALQGFAMGGVRWALPSCAICRRPRSSAPRWP